MDLNKLSPEQRYAFEKFKRGENLFVTGPGGTGKTKLIEYLVAHAKASATTFQVCAMTGCAAILLPSCNARTLHSWSGIRLAKGPKHAIVANVLKNKAAKSNWRKTKILIVDEVSMMSLKIFEVLDEIGRAVRQSALPFGGMQVIFTGDFYQLPPVGSPVEPETEAFCFQSASWTRVFTKTNHVELRTIFRQTDPKYKEILMQVRTATLTEENRLILQSCVKRDFDATKHNGCFPTKLFPTRAKTDFLNKTMFDRLPSPEHTFACEKKTDCKTFLEANTPISLEYLTKGNRMTPPEVDYELQQLMANSSFQEVLSLKIGAVVMCTVNLDMDNGICNGAQGIITDIKDIAGPIKMQCPIVRFSNGIVRTIQPHFRQSEEYPTVAVGQIPLCLAWALTIHKIQGATLALADIDVGGQVFEFGQTYVALSRVQSLDGLYLTAFQAQRIRANDKVHAFYAEFADVNYEEELKSFAEHEKNPFADYELKEDVIVENSSAVKVKTSKTSMDLFVQGRSIEEIASERNLKPSTIFDHILAHLPHEKVSFDRFMTQVEFDEIKAVFDVVGRDVPLKIIKDNLPGRASWDHIKVVHKIYGENLEKSNVKVIRL